MFSAKGLFPQMRGYKVTLFSTRKFLSRFEINFCKRWTYKEPYVPNLYFQIGWSHAQMKHNSRFPNQLIRNYMVLTNTFGFSAKKLVKTESW